MSKVKSKTIVLVGGGSGGHITPLVAIAEQIKMVDSKCRVVHIGHKKDHFNDVTRRSIYIDDVYEVSAGKFRRYHSESFLSHLRDIKTIALNVRDLFRFIRGIYESWFLLRKLKPDNILMKGGYVCVPVGISARLKRIRFITHDSDVVAGLANKIISKWAYIHAHGMPLNKEQLDRSTELFTGIPLQQAFLSSNQHPQTYYKEKLGLISNKIIFVVGGGLGARNINQAIAEASVNILKENNVVIIHITGKNLYEETKNIYSDKLDEAIFRQRVKLIDFTTELHVYSAAADIVITRAGATNLAEFAEQGKACIVIPNPVLTGGQQLQNAKVFKDNNAVEIVEEEELSTQRLRGLINELLNDESRRLELSKNIKKLSQPKAALYIAQILLDIDVSSSGKREVGHEII